MKTTMQTLVQNQNMVLLQGCAVKRHWRSTL